MIIKDITNESQVYKKINDPRQKKMLALAVYHDGSFPRHKLVTLGKSPSDDDVVKLLSDLIDQRLSNTNYGDISREGKYDQWLMRLYQNGAVDWEDISGEGADALGAFRTLSTRGLLQPQHQDINKFTTLRKLISLMVRGPYVPILARLKDEEKIKQLKRDKKDTVLMNTDRFYVSIPYNYGACYVFNNELGVQASFCTGSSATHWFYRYAAEGPMIDVLDKKNPNEVTGKWQIHAPSGQIKAADQNYRDSRDDVFANLFPGLLKEICDNMLAVKDDIKEMSKNIVNPDSNRKLVPEGYDVPAQVALIARTFPLSYNSKPKGEEPPDASEEDLDELFGRNR